ncbi:MAG TPA: HAD family phosphatase [Planctomycetaceae bacterium]|nr:HAD family phosphatase [Planctomycetaceae bacterium]
MTILAVVFDLDGLMFNTEDVFDISGNELLQRRGLRMTDEIRNAMLGRRPTEAIANMLQLTGIREEVDRLITESHEIFFGLVDEHLKPMTGLFELLDHLEQIDMPKAVATSSPRNYMQNILNRFTLLERFHETFTAEDVERGKPEPDIYLKAAKRLGISPHQMMVLEDSEAGTKAASSAGAIAISVPHRHTARHDFSSATHIVKSLADPIIYQLLETEKTRGDRDRQSRR